MHLNDPEVQRKAREKCQERLASGDPIPVSHFERWQAKNTRKTAIDAFFEHCMGGTENPGYRTLIRECTCGPKSSLPCQFYEWRPYK